MTPFKLVRTECVRCPQALLRNKVSTILGIILLSFFLLSSVSHTFLPEGVVLGLWNCVKWERECEDTIHLVRANTENDDKSDLMNFSDFEKRMMIWQLSYHIIFSLACWYWVRSHMKGLSGMLLGIMAGMFMCPTAKKKRRPPSPFALWYMGGEIGVFSKDVHRFRFPKLRIWLLRVTYILLKVGGYV